MMCVKEEAATLHNKEAAAAGCAVYLRAVERLAVGPFTAAPSSPLLKLM